ncbi:DUF2442 domain-containing protein [Sandaracinobacteroides saxicola]|uniref:DUF2442 domain-containing protein n=1 Tax=Sandaracinobacteroides saxicola TaxID=2759707 RepID=A0A7G5IFF7_9SPHN|nr:DUF2442 domain-containing protein [Sandaracinobacteroides saxicola]QMW22099.1 DUF2442 domain-containing protein [Sandaracinobacteroides saxicola]
MDLSDTDIATANMRGQSLLATQPRALTARYDAGSGRIILDLTNGCLFAFPARLVQDLHGATDEDLAQIEVPKPGLGLYWPRLDADVYVPGLVAGIFGTRYWMASEMGRRGGTARSPAKTAAARQNGAKGGRPKKAVKS